LLACGKVWINDTARREIERGALHIYAQNVTRVEAKPGEWVEILHNNETLGYGLYTPSSSISVKLFTKEETSLAEYVYTRLEKLWKTKTRRYKESLRWVFAEGDRIPGLIVDVFGREIASIRISMEGLDQALGSVKEVLAEKGIEHAFVRITQPKERSFFLMGKKFETIIDEYGTKFVVNVVKGQKTGFYLDQRENRRELEKWVGNGDRVLDAFSYTGGFGIHAARQGADVTFVELGKRNARYIERNLRLNDVSGRVVCTDALRFMKKKRGAFDVVVVDPPALARGKNKEAALRMYMNVNRLAIRALGEGILVTSSCTHPVTPKDFIGVVRGAAEKEGREITLLGSLRGQAPDHTVYLPQPETQYLKCIFAVVE